MAIRSIWWPAFIIVILITVIANLQIVHVIVVTWLPVWLRSTFCSPIPWVLSAHIAFDFPFCRISRSNAGTNENNSSIIFIGLCTSRKTIHGKYNSFVASFWGCYLKTFNFLWRRVMFYCWYFLEQGEFNLTFFWKSSMLKIVKYFLHFISKPFRCVLDNLLFASNMKLMNI